MHAEAIINTNVIVICINGCAAPDRQESDFGKLTESDFLCVWVYIFECNSHDAENMNVRWEREVVPTYGESGPQDIINEQLVNKFDILIGVFWTKIGTPTLRASSGTLEEINIFIQNIKAVMVYFLDTPLHRSFTHYSETEQQVDATHIDKKAFLKR